MLYKLQVYQTSSMLEYEKTFTDNLKLNDSDILIVGTKMGFTRYKKDVGDNTLITNTNGDYYFTFEQQINR